MAAERSARGGVAAAMILTFSISVALFSNTLYGEIVYDDKMTVISNSDLKPDTPWLDLFFHDYWGSPINDPNQWSHKSYRPIAVMSLRLNYMFGGYNTFGYHLVNIVLHGLASSLLVPLGLLLNISLFGSTVSAILFGIHPIHSEAVANITSRADVLGAYWKMLLLQFFSLVLMILATLSKEIGITVAGVCVLYEVIFQLPTNFRDKQKRTASLLRIVLSLAAAFSLFYARHRISGGFEIDMDPMFNRLIGIQKLSLRAINIAYLGWYNVYLLVFPKYLSFDYSAMNLIDEESNSIFIIAITLGTVASFIAITYFSVKSLMGSSSQNLKQTIFFLGWMSGTHLPASQLLFYVGFLIAERILYIPSCGYCFLIGILCDWINRKIFQNKSYVTIPICLAIFSILAVKTWHRNNEWNTPETLFRSGIDVFPSKIAYHGLGWQYYQKGDFDTALRWFEYIPDDPSALFLSGKIAISRQEYGKAADFFDKVLEDNPMHSCNNEYGMILWMTGHQEAGANRMLRAQYSKLPSNAPETLGITCNVGCVYLSWKIDYPKALEFAQRAWDKLNMFSGGQIPVNYTSATFALNLGSAYAANQKLDEALHYLKIAAQMAPEFIENYNNLVDSMRGLALFTPVCKFNYIK